MKEVVEPAFSNPIRPTPSMISVIGPMPRLPFVRHEKTLSRHHLERATKLIRVGDRPACRAI
jgi:hypothetical protein